MGMVVQGSPSPVLRDALAVAAQIHSVFDRHADKGTSATSCVHASLALADFLSRLGIEAEALPVAVVIRAMQDGKQTHLHRVGSAAYERPRGKWNGHMIVVADRFLIDPTFRQFNAAGLNGLPDMLALPSSEGQLLGLRLLGRFGASLKPGHVYNVAWIHTPENTGWQAWDDRQKQGIRKAVVTGLLRQHAKLPGHDATEHPPTSDQKAPLSAGRRT